MAEMFVSPQKIQAEILTPKAVVLVGEAFDVIRS